MAGLEPDIARKQGGGKKAAIERVWHEPEVTSHDASEAEYIHPPKPLLTMQRAAVKAGWDCEITYARGHTPPSAIADGKRVHSYALRMKRGAQRCVAAWESVAHLDEGGWFRHEDGFVVRELITHGSARGAIIDRIPGLSWTFKDGLVLAYYVCARTGRRDRGITRLGAGELGKFIKAIPEDFGDPPTEDQVRALAALAA